MKKLTEKPMKLLANKNLLKLFNAGLRLGSLSFKLVLTLYMGKYLGLTEMGTYGLVAAYVAIAIPLLGFRLNYVVSREIVAITDFDLVRKMRDQAVCYALNYLVAILGVAIMVVGSYGGLDQGILLYTLGLCILESIAAITSGNLISLGRPILSNVLFFIRSALWVVPVIVLGVLDPVYRTADFIFLMWLGGIVLSLIGTWIAWRKLPWLEGSKSPIDWDWIKVSIKRCIPIWFGGVAAAISGNLDRFIVEVNLGRDFVGIISFYSSFILAISALLASGVFAFGYPELIRLYKDKAYLAFREETRKITLQAAFMAGVISLAMAIGIPMLGKYFDRPEFIEHAPVFWLMLISVWMKSSTESLYYVLYAWSEDRMIWSTSLMFLGLALTCNIILVPIYGFIGVGYSAVLTATFLCGWRIYCVNKVRHLHEQEAPIA